MFGSLACTPCCPLWCKNKTFLQRTEGHHRDRRQPSPDNWNTLSQCFQTSELEEINFYDIRISWSWHFVVPAQVNYDRKSNRESDLDLWDYSGGQQNSYIKQVIFLNHLIPVLSIFSILVFSERTRWSPWHTPLKIKKKNWEQPLHTRNTKP